MKLASLLQASAHLVTQITGSAEIEIQHIRHDSRLVTPADVFVAIKGATVDGHAFIDNLLQKGIRAIVAETAAPKSLPKDTVWIETKHSAELLGQMASAYYAHPSKQMQVIGVTGTNGKTTVATLLFQAFTAMGKTCGLVSTVENRIGNQILPSTHTTPDALALQALFAQMRDAGCTHVFMEVSSHAIHQRRIAGTAFAGGIFTNITHDHLDYHGTFAEYLKAKKRFFDDMPDHAWVVTNLDDRNGSVMVQNTKARIQTYALKRMADVKGKVLVNALSGLQMQVNDLQIHARLIGSFNASNLLAVFAAATLMGIDKDMALKVISNLRGAEGRFEYISHQTITNCGGIVDYAHTPDALQKVMETIRLMQKKSGRLITVVGCGGNRDRTKRPVMARLAVEYSHLSILTSDNPRMEDPNVILSEMQAGLNGQDTKKWLTIADREQAIKTACQMLQPGDVILVAGKGHEKYQDIMGVKHPFDDREVLEKYLK